jgi:hypothetical protein
MRHNGEMVFSLHDPEGFGQSVFLPQAAMIAAALMNGRRTLTEIRTAFRARVGRGIAAAHLTRLVADLDAAYLLDGRRFRAHRQEEMARYLAAPVRPAAHAGTAYAEDPEALRRQLAGFYTDPKGPGAAKPSAPTGGRRLCGIVSPHIDPLRGGPAFAWAYRRLVEESDADRFIIFGTAHGPMANPFCVARKDVATPLGVVQTDVDLVERLAGHLASSVAGRRIDPFADEFAHRHEHSIEFQVLFLQHALVGRRPFRVVPVLAGSFQPFFDEGTSPEQSPAVQAFIAAVRAAMDEHPGRVCCISGADLGHVGLRFGDDWLVDDDRLAEQAADDRELLQTACQGDAAALFQHVARQNDRRRICGLAPTYTMLEVLQPVRGELLTYDQSVDPDGSACVSFASVALYHR